MNIFWKYSSKFHINFIKNFWSTSSNFVIFTGQLPWYQLMVPAKLRENRLRIDWDTSQNWVKIMTKMPRDLWIRIVDSGCVAIATVLAFLSFFVWRLLTSESDVKNRQTVKKGCFTSPSIRAISEKQSFLVHFQLGIISWKKKKKKKIYWVYVAIVLVNTLLLLATCPVSLNCSVTHEQRGALTQCCFNDGPHFQRSGDVETVLFQCITLITFGILYQTSPNLQGSRRNGCEWCVQKYMWSDWELTEISIKNATAELVQCWFSVLH